MNKDCNGCFGASFNDCQRCQREADTKQPPKLDITLELAIAEYNKLIDYCKQFNQEVNCRGCIFDKIRYPKSDRNICDMNFHHICPADWDKITFTSLDGNTVTHIKDGQIKRITCGCKEEAQELFEEVKGRRTKLEPEIKS